MEVHKIKIQSDGTLDKGKVRIVARGDLQNKWENEDNWSPTTSQKGLKLFVADAAKNKARIRQLDFISAFLQAPVRRKTYVQLPGIFGELVPEYADFVGKPLRLLKSIYGMGSSSRFWFEELWDWLVDEQVFSQSKCGLSLFWQTDKTGTINF